MSMNENMSERENDEPLEEPLHCRFLLCEVERTALDDSVVHVSRIIVIIVNTLVLELYRLFVIALSLARSLLNRLTSSSMTMTMKRSDVDVLSCRARARTVSLLVS